MGRERSFRTEAIILRRSDFGESDRILTLFGREQGKFRAIAKGVRKATSRKMGHIELFMCSNLLLAQGQSLPIITQADVVEAHRGLAEELARVAYASYAAELLDAFAPEQERQTALYELLKETLGRFSRGENLLLAARYYELNLLRIAGFQPQLFYCVVTNEVAQLEDQWFSPELGGVIRPEHRPEGAFCRPISAPAVKLLRYVQTHSWANIAELHLRRSLHLEIEGLMHHYLRHLLERRVKSAEFLLRLRRETETSTSADTEH